MGLQRAAWRVIVAAAASSALLAPAGFDHQGVARAATPTGTRGHFHALAAPARVISSDLGRGVPRGPVAAGATLSLSIGGHGGVPATNVLAVSVAVTALAPTGATNLWLGTGATHPSVPVVATAAGPASAYAILPVSPSGEVTLWNGPHATGLTIDVSGWYSSASEATPAGLLRRLAGREVGGGTIAHAAARTLVVVGKEDVPAHGVGAMLFRLHVTATSPGTITLASSAATAAGVTSISYGRGSTSDLVVTRPSRTGAVVVRNAGPATVSVTVDAVGWFTDGSDPHAHGDTLHVAPSISRVLTATSVGKGGVTSGAAGAGGIPQMSVRTPPSLVLVRTTTRTGANPLDLFVDAAGSTPTGMVAGTLRKNATQAMLVLAPPGSKGKARWSTNAASTRVTAEAYAWFAGDVIVAAGTHVLDGATLAAVRSVAPASVTFTGFPHALSDLAIGHFLTAGSSATTPEGLMRRVTGVDRSSGNLVVATEAASVGDVILQGSISVGSASEAPPAPPTSTAAAIRGAGRPYRAVLPDCSVTAGSLSGGFGAAVSCSNSFVTPSWSATVTGSAGTAVRMEGDFSAWTAPYVKVSVIASTSTSLIITSLAEATIDEEIAFHPVRLPMIEVPIGPVQLVMFPYFTPKIKLKGDVAATLEGSATLTSSLELSYSTTDGFGASPSTTASATLSYQGVKPLTVKASIPIGITVYFYADPRIDLDEGQGGSTGAGLYFSVGPYALAEANTCEGSIRVGGEATIGITLRVFHEDLVDESHDFDLGSTQVLHVDFRNCARWSGTINYRAHGNYVAAGGGYRRDTVSTSSMTIPEPSTTPTYDIYPATASGSGSMIDRQLITCGVPGGGRVTETNTTTIDWSGNITAIDQPLTVAIWRVDPNGRTYLFSLSSPGSVYMQVPATRQLSWWLDPCELQQPPPENITWSGPDVFALVDPPGGDTDTFTFTLPAGQSHVSGDRSIAQDGLVPARSIHFDLHKTCSTGGTDC